VKKQHIEGLLLGLLLVSCKGGKQPLEYESFCYQDSSQNAVVHIQGQLPIARDKSEQAMRDTMLYLMQSDICTAAASSDSIILEPYNGTCDSVNLFAKHYGRQLYDTFYRLSQADWKERESMIQSDSTLSETEKISLIENGPQWMYSLDVKHVSENNRYLVLSFCDYIYQGGAHGGISGAGAVTFAKQTGQRISKFLIPDCEEKIQPLLVTGLLLYYTQDEDEIMTEPELMERLLLEGNTIPLTKQYPPYPTSEGLVFTYGQYEIACYADGMPSFCIPYSQIEPFLLPEVKQLIVE